MSVQKQPIGNESQMEEIRRTMELHQKVQQGGNREEGEYIDFESLEGTQYQGTVVFKKANIGDTMRIGGLKSEILRAAGVIDLNLVDDAIKTMAHIVSTLEVVAVKRPEWLLKPMQVKEPEILYHVYSRYQTWENSFRRDLQPRDAEDTEAGAGEEAVDTP